MGLGKDCTFKMGLRKWIVSWGRDFEEDCILKRDWESLLYPTVESESEFRKKNLTGIDDTVASVVWAEGGLVPEFPFTTHSTFPKFKLLKIEDYYRKKKNTAQNISKKLFNKPFTLKKKINFFF